MPVAIAATSCAPLPGSPPCRISSPLRSRPVRPERQRLISRSGEPGGLSTRQVINLIQSIDQPIVAADIVEYNPSQDLSNMTALVAAKLTKEIAGMMLKTALG